VALGQLGLASLALAGDRRDEANACSRRCATRARRRRSRPRPTARRRRLRERRDARLQSAGADGVVGDAVRSGRASRATPLLYALTAIAVDDKDWPERSARASARERVPDFRRRADALERVGAGAAAASSWQIALESTKLLRERYPQMRWRRRRGCGWPRRRSDRSPAEARPALEQFVAASPNSADAPRAWLALARAREAAGDRAGALERTGADRATCRRRLDARGALRPRAAARSGQALGRRAPDLERLLKSSEPATAAEAAYALGETYNGEGDALAPSSTT